MMTFKNLRTTEYFSQLWCEIETFAKDNDISIQTPSKGCKRKRQEPTIFKHFDVTAITSAEHSIDETNETVESYFKKKAFFPVVIRGMLLSYRMASGTSSKKAPGDKITAISSSALALMSTVTTVRILKNI
ncbi:uncharacterized protein LOC132925978 [Rhopalosiphum padi]|uniref:uncharacterized protein LOC132925978 n=1 Tax=Rhopalosiphum padi TaxID=40932 RepID=UPI00298D9F56|nr:uncharacterized protein LOC132925978 [Rhopalosiphum padi]